MRCTCFAHVSLSNAIAMCLSVVTSEVLKMCSNVSLSFVMEELVCDILWFISINFFIVSFFAIVADAKLSNAWDTSVVIS